MKASLAKCSAETHRFSPDMKIRWLPTIGAEVVGGGDIPITGYRRRAEAVAAARVHQSEQDR